MPKILHTQTGLEIRKNDKNEFCVVRLHYTADPARRSEQWKREAMAGMTPAQWRQEQEIDYEAQSGEKVFPEFVQNRSKIVIPASYDDELGRSVYIEFPKDQKYYGGLDYGTLNPSSFHVYAILDGVTYAVWELYEPCKNVKDFTDKMKACPYWDRVQFVMADPSMWFKNQQDATGLTDLYTRFSEHGVWNMQKGVKDEPSWTALMHDHWRNEDFPTFRIFACCPAMIKEFERATYVTMSASLQQKQNYKEMISDKDNHALDDCKYFMSAGLRGQQQKSLKLPRMVDRWRH